MSGFINVYMGLFCNFVSGTWELHVVPSSAVKQSSTGTVKQHGKMRNGVLSEGFWGSAEKC